MLKEGQIVTNRSELSGLSHKAVVVEEKGRPEQIIGFLGLLLALLCFLCLASYNPGDFPNSSAAPARVKNLLGPLGAQLGYTLFILLGDFAYIIPGGLLVWSWPFFTGQKRRFGLPHFLLSLIFLVQLGILLHNLLPLDETTLFSFGGALALIGWEQLSAYLPWWGQYLVLGMGLGVSVLGVFRTSRSTRGLPPRSPTR